MLLGACFLSDARPKAARPGRIIRWQVGLRVYLSGADGAAVHAHVLPGLGGDGEGVEACTAPGDSANATDTVLECGRAL